MGGSQWGHGRDTESRNVHGCLMSGRPGECSDSMEGRLEVDGWEGWLSGGSCDLVSASPSSFWSVGPPPSSSSSSHSSPLPSPSSPLTYEIRGLGLEVKTHPQDFLPSLISLTPYTQPLSSPPSSHSHLTYMSYVDVFATGIKIESSNQSPFWGPIKGSR